MCDDDDPLFYRHAVLWWTDTSSTVFIYWSTFTVCVWGSTPLIQCSIVSGSPTTRHLSSWPLWSHMDFFIFYFSVKMYMDGKPVNDVLIWFICNTVTGLFCKKYKTRKWKVTKKHNKLSFVATGFNKWWLIYLFCHERNSLRFDRSFQKVPLVIKTNIRWYLTYQRSVSTQINVQTELNPPTFWSLNIQTSSVPPVIMLQFMLWTQGGGRISVTQV